MSSPVAVPLDRDRPFVLRWSAQTASLTGSGITAAIPPVLVYDRSGSVDWTDLLTALEVLPDVAFGAVAVAVADRADRQGSWSAAMWERRFCGQHSVRKRSIRFGHWAAPATRSSADSYSAAAWS
ncbi:MAG TPA: hypothetical protein VNF24_04910 [Candidatus Acidoferrales bacterium]|nr:hypothetical protein [Candidatus Acidoferrales bacterium]